MSIEKKSKFLSGILRHFPSKIGIDMDPNGWVVVADLCRLMPISRSELEEIVRTDEKGRYSFSTRKDKIRANQGHSLKVNIEMLEVQPPEILYHGTATKNIDSIMSYCLLPKNRNYVHLSLVKETALQVGSRHGKPVILKIDSGKMWAKGHKFWISENSIWQVLEVPPEFIEVIYE